MLVGHGVITCVAVWLVWVAFNLWVVFGVFVRDFCFVVLFVSTASLWILVGLLDWCARWILICLCGFDCCSSSVLCMIGV